MAANPVARIAELSLTSNHKASTNKVPLAGSITSATGPALERTLCRLIPNFQRIVLNLSNVEHIDNSGFGVLVNVYIRAKRENCDLEIENPMPRLKDRLQSWLHSVFEGHEEFLGMTPD